jgi:hypothetical protein
MSVVLVYTCDGCKKIISEGGAYLNLYIAGSGTFEGPRAKLLDGKANRQFHACCTECLEVVISEIRREVTFLSKEEICSQEEYGAK